MSALLRLSGVSASYGGPRVLHDVDLEVGEGEIVCLLGANGAGKTTTLRAVSGTVPVTGEVVLEGRDLVSVAPHKRAALGLAHIPQGRGTLIHLTVEENLWAGSTRLGRKERKHALDHWFDVFPRLAERRRQAAGSLSGGEQQMLAIARALVGGPRLVLLDEPSLGLAPLIVAEVFERLSIVNAELGTALLVVEQNAAASLAIAQRAYVIENGHIVREAPAQDLVGDDAIRRSYLGV